MDNQQATLLGWMCGIIDGEGTVGVYIRDRKEGKKDSKAITIRPVVSVANTDTDLVERYIHCLDTLEIPYHVSQRAAQGRRRARWTVQTSGLKRVRKALPHLIGGLTGRKNENAVDLLEYIDSRLSDWASAPFTTRQLELVERIYARNGGRRRLSLRDYTRSSRSSKFPEGNPD